MSKNFLKHPERRYHQRLDIGLEVQAAMEDGKTFSTQTGNISCGGLFLSMKKPDLPPDAELAMTLNLPNSDRPVKVLGQVARVYCSTTDPRLKASEEGLAIKFSGLFDDNILAIDSFIKNKLH